MLKLTRLNNQVVAINPDHIGWVDASPDTTLFLIGGEKIIVRETLDELIVAVVTFRRMVRATEPFDAVSSIEGDPPRIGELLRARKSDPPYTSRSMNPRGER